MAKIIWGDRPKGRVLRGILLVLLVLVLGAAVWFTFFGGKACGDFDCFQKKMQKCERADLINEQPEASWKYQIVGTRGGECAIDVTLLQAKEGELGIQELEGLEMRCLYPKGRATYPESDLNRCSGELKEEMQEIVIRRLHTYILENLGELSGELSKAI